MIKGRRPALQAIRKEQAQHPGLWLDKYIGPLRGPDDPPPRRSKTGPDPLTEQQTLVNEVAEMRVPAAYGPFYRRWTEALRLQGASLAPATVQGRMVVGLGAESVLETAVTLHRTYGVPYLPGSALKGLTAAYARQRLPGWEATSAAYITVFGNSKTGDGPPDSAGYLTFFDALYIPGSAADDCPLYPDVITVHHPEYYRTGKTAPADWDSPNPVPFLSAVGSYLVALTGPSDWLAATFQILRLALAAEGIGAKTSSGYGRLELAKEKQL